MGTEGLPKREKSTEETLAELNETIARIEKKHPELKGEPVDTESPPSHKEIFESNTKTMQNGAVGQDLRSLDWQTKRKEEREEK